MIINKDKVYIKFLLIRILLSTNLILSIRVLYMIAFNISYGEIGVLRSIFAFTVTFFELPTGIIADKVSRRLSMLIASVFFAAHSIVYIFFPSYTGFIIAQIMLGVSISFISGADSSYLHNYIKNNTKDDFLKVTGDIRYISKWFLAILSIISSIIYNINPHYNFAITFIMGIVAFIVVFSLPRDSMVSYMEILKKSFFKEVYILTKDAIKNLLENKYLMKIIIYTSITFTFLIINFEYYQILLQKLNFPSKYNGSLYASFMIFMGIGYKISSKLVRKYSTYSIFYTYMILISSTFFIFSKTSSLYIVLLGIMVQQICFGSWELILENMVLEESPEDNMKSTISSLNSLVTNIIKAICSLILAFMFSKLGYKFSYIIMGICIIAMIIINYVLTLFKKIRGK